MRETKDSNIKWVGEIPSTWITELGKHFMTCLDRPVKEDDGVITCFRDGEVTLRSKRREEGFTVSFQEIGYQGIEPGDLVVHGMDGFAGAIGISDSRGKATPVLNVLNTEQDKRYMMYTLRNMAYTDVFLALSTGIRVRSCDTSWKKLRSLEYALPPLDEQRKIADKIEQKSKQVDALIANQQAQIEKLKQYKQSLITEVVTKGLDPNVPMKDSEVEWIGTIPETWECIPIKYLSSFNDETLAENTDPDLEFDYIEIGSVEFGKGIIGTEHMKFLDAPSRARRIVKENDIIVSTVRTYLKAVAPIPHSKEQLIASTGFVVIRPKAVDPSFLRYAILSTTFISRVEAYSVGISYPAINASQVVQFKVPVPSREKQVALSSFLEEKCKRIDKLIEIKRLKSEMLRHYKKSLIYEYVTGKKEVV